MKYYDLSDEEQDRQEEIFDDYLNAKYPSMLVECITFRPAEILRKLYWPIYHERLLEFVEGGE